jgi:filamentous hemagglutinin family protein
MKGGVMSGIIQNWRYWCRFLVVGSVLIASFQARVFAQITPDSTLPNNSNVTREGNTFNITGGTQAGSNLFHSFGEFSVPNGGAATFNNALDIQNIISRVTGGSTSNIDGLIRTSGTASLFLINPNGIIFGRNASLNIGGSFIATTASAIGFGDRGFFSASNPESSSSLLTVNPTALLFNQIKTAPIQNNSVAPSGLNPSSAFIAKGLRVPDGKSLLLVGGDINMDGGGLYAFGGRVELGGSSFAGTVGLNGDGNNLSLNFPDNVERSDVYLSNRAAVRVTASNGGSIAINARNLNMTRSKLSAGIESELVSDNKAGNIEVNATGAMTIGNFSSIENVVSSYGNGGDINIKAGSLLLTRSAKLSTNITGQGDAGNISVQSNGDVSLVNSSINSNVIEGNTGSISVQANGSVSFSRSVISTEGILGKGNAGSISVQANGSVSFSKNSIFTNAKDGNAGSISVRAEGNILSNTLDEGKAGNIINFENNEIYTSTSSKGNAGNILVQANGNMDFIANGISSKTSEEGNTGNISVLANGNIFFKQNGISTGALVLDNRIFSRNIIPTQGNVGNISVQANGNINFESNTITSETSNKGDAGNILLQAKGNIDFTYNGITSRTSNQGDAGNILVQAGNNVSSVDDEFVSNTSSKGDAGNILVQADGKVSFASGFISSESGFSREQRYEVEGKGGDIYIQSRAFSVTDGARVSATTYGKGDAGNIQVEALDSVTLSGINANNGFSSGLFTNTEKGASRQGGDIKVQTRDLHIFDGAVLNARTRSDFNGGNITVNVKTLEVTGGGQMVTTAFSSGNAGKITVNAADSISISGSNPTYDDQLAQFGKDEFYPVSAASGIFSNTNPNSTGNGGIIEVNGGQLNVHNRAQVSVSSAGSGDAGSLNIETDSIRLDNKAKISADTSGGGGNINLRSPLLVLRRGSSVTTNAQGSNIAGGNITIDAPNGFIVAVSSENSDISANSTEFYGGKVTINAQGIFGAQFRDVASDSTSDITATGVSAEFSGTVELNTPEIDPNSGLVELPTIPVDTRIAQSCQSPSYTQSSFVINGRGGLPPNPKDILTPQAPQIDWVSIKPSNNNRSLPPVTSKLTNSTPKRIVEATGATLNESGQVVLSANSSTISPHGSKQNPIQCHGS